jgi:hypothetical protein
VPINQGSPGKQAGEERTTQPHKTTTLAMAKQSTQTSSAWVAVLTALVVGLLAFGVSFYRHHHHPTTCTLPPPLFLIYLFIYIQLFI